MDLSVFNRGGIGDEYKRTAKGDLRSLLSLRDKVRDGSTTLRLLDYVCFQSRKRGGHFLLLLLRYLEFVQRRDQVPHRDVPIFFGDAQPLVRSLHIAANVQARPARRRAQLIDHELPDLLLGVGTRSDEEAANLGVGRKS